MGPAKVGKREGGRRGKRDGSEATVKPRLPRASPHLTSPTKFHLGEEQSMQTKVTALAPNPSKGKESVLKRK